MRAAACMNTLEELCRLLCAAAGIIQRQAAPLAMHGIDTEDGKPESDEFDILTEIREAVGSDGDPATAPPDCEREANHGKSGGLHTSDRKSPRRRLGLYLGQIRATVDASEPKRRHKRANRKLGSAMGRASCCGLFRPGLLGLSAAWRIYLSRLKYDLEQVCNRPKRNERWKAQGRKAHHAW